MAEITAETLLTLLQAGDHAAVCRQAPKLLARQPDDASSWFLLGIAQRRSGDLGSAVASYRRALALKPDHPDIWFNLGNALGDLAQQDATQWDAARDAYARAVAVQPGHVDAWRQLRDIARRRNDVAGECAAAAAVLAVQPADAETRVAHVRACRIGGRLAEALASFHAGLQHLGPTHSGLLIEGAQVLEAQGDYRALVAVYERLSEQLPDNAVVRFHLGLNLLRVNRNTPALAALRAAESMGLEEHALWVNLGTALARLDQVDEALVYLDRAAPDYRSDPSAFVYAFALRQKLCDWSRVDGLRETLLLPAVGEVGANGYPPLPFPFVSFPGEISEGEQRVIAEHFARFIAKDVQPFRAHPWVGRHDRLRIGYLSADFHDHATAHLMLGMFQQHDRRRFEVFAYSYGPEDGSEYRRRIRAEVEHFVDLATLTDRDAAARIYRDEIDILIDLKGYTREARNQIPAWRPAPVQVAWLGFPGSMGADFIDYIVTDARVTPPVQQPHYSERFLYMPDCYQINDDTQPIAAELPDRAALGLPAKAFVFCCFNAHYKINPPVFAVWMDLLRRVPDSVLWLIDGYAPARERLCAHAEAAGIARERLIFSPRLKKAEHLARHDAADLFLDTFQCNAHTTMSDALWAGLPGITLRGKIFANRVAASLLENVGLGELVADSVDAYRDLALSLAGDRPRLKAIRRRLQTLRQVTPLFDTWGFVRDLERRFLDIVPPNAAEAARRAAAEQGLRNAVAALSAERNDEALAHLEKVLGEGCDRPDAWSLYAVALRRKERLDEAEFAYRRGLGLKPDYVDLIGNYGNLLRDSDRLPEAIELYRQACTLAPDNVTVWKNLGSASAAYGLTADALAAFTRAIELAPDDADAHWDRSLALLMQHRLGEGLDEYAWRYRRQQPPPRSYPKPEWCGEPLAGQRLFLHWEQGYGDSLQFLRFVPLAVARGARVVMEVQPGMKRLCGWLDGVVEAVDAGEPLPEFDCWAPLLELPRLLGIDEHSLPAATPYLTLDDALVADWGQRLGKRKGLRIGLIWAGNPNVKNDRLRSPRLAPLQRLFELKGAQWVILQQGDGRKDLAGVKLPAGSLDLAAQVTDFADTAALMRNLDLVITSDTSTAHLAAALGCPTWVLLHYASDWRWGLGERSPWYPQARLFRQPAFGDWAGVVDAVADALRKDCGLRGKTGKNAALPASTAAPGEALLQGAFGHYQQGRLELARRLARASLAQQPARADAWCLLGVVEKMLGHAPAAEAAYRAAIEQLPGYADAWFNLGNLLRTQGRLDDAEAAYRSAAEAAPNNAQAWSMLSDVQRELKHLASAERAARRAVAVRADLAEAWNHLGNALNDQERFAEAMDAYARAIALPGATGDMRYNFGVALQRSRQTAEAIACYRQVLAANPANALAHYNLSTALLTLGEFAEGFREFEWRLKKGDLYRRPYPQPEWRGESLAGRRILLYWEQGCGDTIQFLRFVAPVVALGGQVVLHVQPGLRALGAALPGVVAVAEGDEALPPFDTHAPLLSVPACLGLGGEALDERPFLVVPEARRQRWQDGLPPAAGKLRVGLVWAGNPEVKNDRVRSPRLAPLLPLLDLPGVDWVILQKGDGRRDLDQWPAGVAKIDIAPDLGDFADTAAVMAQLDLVISTDTSTAHLAAGLGVDSFILLHFAADWRWMQGEATAWYPRAQLFRQRQPGDWGEVIARLRAAVLARCTAGRHDGGLAWRPQRAVSRPAVDYCICTIAPPGYLHHAAFDEVAEVLCGGLRELGLTAMIRQNAVDTAARNIIIGCHLLDFALVDSIPAASIILNTEQLGTDERGWNELIYRWAARFPVWDYSPRNIAVLHEKGVPGARLLRLGYQAGLDRIVPAAVQDIDVLFYGSMNPRRQQVLDALKAQGLNVVEVFGVYGAERDALIARAKVVLNLHYFAAQIFEIVRVFYLMTNGKAVVAEVGPGTQADPAYLDGICAVPYEGLVEACVGLVRDDARRAALEAASRRVIQGLPQAALLRELLD